MNFHRQNPTSQTLAHRDERFFATLDTLTARHHSGRTPADTPQSGISPPYTTLMHNCTIRKTSFRYCQFRTIRPKPARDCATLTSISDNLPQSSKKHRNNSFVLSFYNVESNCGYKQSNQHERTKRWQDCSNNSNQPPRLVTLTNFRFLAATRQARITKIGGSNYNPVILSKPLTSGSN